MNVRAAPATTDVELARNLPTSPPHLDGYPSFAHFIARDGDAAIYRRFSHLSARNLLYLQSELHSLDDRLRILDAEDASDITNEEAPKAAREWRYLSDDANPRARLHREIHEQFRVKLKEYRR